MGQQYTAAQQAVLNQLFALAAVGAIPGAWLQDNTVTGDKLAADSVTGDKLAGNIPESKLALVQRRIDDERTGDGATQAYTLARAPVTPSCLLVIYNTTIMSRNGDYTLSGTQVTLSFAPVSGSQIRFNYDAWFTPQEALNA